MKVLMISLDKTLLGGDYSGDVLERHQEYARRAGHLDIIVFSKKGFEKKEINYQLTIYPTNSLSKLNYTSDALKIVKTIIHKNKIDLIITQDPFLTGWTGWRVKRKFRIPLLIHFHGDFWENPYWSKERWYNKYLLFLSKFLVKRSSGIRVVSFGIRNKLMKEGVDKNKIQIIPTPVDIESFINYDQNYVEDFRKTHEHRPTILNVARLDKSKDFKNLFETFYLISKKIPKIVFWQVGAGFNKREIEKMIGKRFPEETMFSFTGSSAYKGTPKTEKNNLINIYHASDIYVSSSCHESFGKVLVEAMAAGLPVVATETTGSKGIIIDGENGFLVPIGDGQALAEKILYLLNNPERAKQMGEAGRKMVKERFNRQKIIQQIINFWSELSKQ